MINQLINNVPRLLKFREINFHELQKKRKICENLATRKFPSIRYKIKTNLIFSTFSGPKHVVNIFLELMYVLSFHPPSSSYTTLVIPAWTITLAQTLQGYLVTYSVHSLTEGGIPIMALYSACDTNWKYTNQCICNESY